MPIFNQQFFHGANREPHPQGLAAAGPILEVEIAVPTALAQLLQQQNQPIPPSVVGLALIDTGASRTCVDQSAIHPLGLNPIGVVQVGTPSGGAQQTLYPAKLRFPAQKMEFEFEQVIGTNLTGQVILGRPLIALIGREVLERCLLVYNGPIGTWTLSL